jgi:DNA-binding transcriptional LysR family regulator
LEWLALDGPDDPNGYIATLFSQFNSPMPTRVVRCSSITLYVELGARLNAVTHWGEMAFSALNAAFRDGRMTRLVLAGTMPRLNVSLVYQDKELLTPAATRFVQLLEASVSKHRSRGDRMRSA